VFSRVENDIKLSIVPCERKTKKNGNEGRGDRERGKII
jgi:hypothetical protein